MPRFLLLLVTLFLALAPVLQADSRGNAAAPGSHDSLRLFRNATMRITYAGLTFLTDPMLSEKGGMPGFVGIASNPTVALPVAPGEIVRGVGYVIVSHLHPDHFDEAAARLLPRSLPILCRSEELASFSAAGFTNVVPIADSHRIGEVTITRIGGQHGKGKILERLGTVAGFVFQAPGHPTLYWIGDSIWCDEVEAAIRTHKPDVIISHSGGATIPGFEPILMDLGQTLQLAKIADKATIVAVHLEALDHCVVTRSQLREAAEKQGISGARLRIPADGEEISF